MSELTFYKFIWKFLMVISKDKLSLIMVYRDDKYTFRPLSIISKINYFYEYYFIMNNDK